MLCSLIFSSPHGYQNVRCHSSKDHVPFNNGHNSRKEQKDQVGLVVKATFTNLVSMAETLLTKGLRARKWTAGSASSSTVKLLSQKVICKELLGV